jgi:peptidoglycan/xylan/chitin deacetylase (PgdA/CDA1 family)
MSAEASRHFVRAAILTYHAIEEWRSVLSTPPRLFAQQMRVLADSGVRVVPLTDLPRLIASPSAGPPAVALTFDDGFLSVYDHALPALAEHGFPATVFVVSDYCGRTNGWPTQPPLVSRRPLLGWRELRELARAGVKPGCHSRTHPDLRNLGPDEMSEEIAGAKARIEDAVGVPVETFAYPYGAYDGTVRALAAAHFSLACATTLGFAGPRSDPFALERLDMYYLRNLALLARLFASPVQGYLRVRRMLRDLRSALVA